MRQFKFEWRYERAKSSQQSPLQLLYNLIFRRDNFNTEYRLLMNPHRSRIL